ncbi:unnamed protein product [Brassica napus]|uniref:(rape) hypothetical protein n=1 Tax=Brassica napus TaxID=3708 RepID=A0A816XAU8_BRANA|nr:unnamed protein product [Brassica napus]
MIESSTSLRDTSSRWRRRLTRRRSSRCLFMIFLLSFCVELLT